MASKIARALAQKLIEIYAKRKLPRYAELNRKFPEGFTRERIERNPENSLFQMILIAVYDRWPFTQAAGGFEPIWGLIDSGQSLPSILRSTKLFNLDSVLAMSTEEIDLRLAQYRFYNYRLNSDGKHTQYCRTLKESADLVSNHNLLSDIRQARTASDVVKIHRHLDNIHGIGPPIASKMVMYSLRELPFFGSIIHPRELYPAVKPILQEYHNQKFAQELKSYYRSTIVEEVFEVLKELGEPFALDALYYVDRDEPELKKCLLGMTETEAVSTKEVEMGKASNGEKLEVTLPPDKMRQLEALAREYGQEPTTLASIWVIDHLRQPYGGQDNVPAPLYRVDESDLASKPVTVIGTIVKPGVYGDHAERWEISIAKTQRRNLSYRIDEYPVKVNLVIGTDEYDALLLFVPSQDGAAIRAPLNDRAVRLVDALKSKGFERGHVELQVEGKRIVVLKQLNVFNR